jgi:hypothetical protein
MKKRRFQSRLAHQIHHQRRKKRRRKRKHQLLRELRIKPNQRVKQSQKVKELLMLMEPKLKVINLKTKKRNLHQPYLSHQLSKNTKSKFVIRRT